jgi:hypothetical protein
MEERARTVGRMAELTARAGMTVDGVRCGEKGVYLKRDIPTAGQIAWDPHDDDEAEDMRGGGS